MTINSDFYRKITLLFSSSLTIMAGATIAPSLPQISESFSDAPYAQMLTRLILTFHSLFVALFSPAAGYVADRFGRRNLLVFSLVLYALSGASGTFLTSLWAMLLGRALLGVSVAGVMTAAIALIGDYYTGSKRNEFMGLQSAFMAFGGVVFVTTGGALADIDWRGPFYVYLFALLIVPIALSCIYEPRRRDGPGSSQYASEGPIPVFHIGLVYLITFTSMVSIFMVPVLLPFHLANLTDVSNAHVGFAIGASIMAAGVSSLTYGRVKARMSFPGIVSVAFLLMATGYGVLSFSETYYMVILSLIITGAGNGFMMPNVNLWAVTLAPNRVRGRVVGGLTTFLSLGQFFSPILVQPLVSFTSIGHSYGVAAGILLSLSAIFAIGGSKLDKGQ